MAEESEAGPLTELGKVIPSVYYDIIARVSSGTPFLMILLWDHRETFGDELTLAKLTLLLGAGYVAGLLLTAFTFLWMPVQFLVLAILRVQIRDWRRGLQRNDEISARNEQAGATIAKMQAEATLCQNLFTGFLLLILLNDLKLVPLSLINTLGSAGKWLMLAVLGLAGIFRGIVYFGRQNSLYEIFVTSQPNSPPRSQTPVAPASD